MIASRRRKFLSYYKPYRRLFLTDMLCALIVAAITLLFPLCAQYITENLLQPDNPDALSSIYAMGALMLGLVIVYALCNIFVDHQGHVMGARMESDMRRELFDHYQKLSFRFYDEQKTGQLMSRLTHDTFAMSELYHHGPEDIVIGTLTFTGAFVILLTINAPLTLLLFLLLPIMAAYAFYFNKRMNAALTRSKARIADVNAQVEDTLAGIRVVKSFTNEEIERGKFNAANQRFVDSRSDGYKSEAFFSAGMIAFTQLLTIAVIIFGAAGIVSGALDLPDLLTYMLCVGILIDPIHRGINFARLYQEGITGFNRFMELLEIEPDIDDAPDAVTLIQVRGDIEFRDVSFKYRDDHNAVIKRLSLRVAAGETIALVGSSGVGKTTLCALIPRFYEVSGGAIFLDGLDLRTIRQRSLREKIGVVQQDVYLFAGTVADNIRYGKLDATHEEIVAAAQRAHAHDFIMALPDGYETDIGQRGVKLSGGQKQRLSIARVFLKDPPILILDEATSALDYESEKAVQASLEALTQNRTTFIIAHRLSTVRDADRIVVLTEDGISEEGTHDTLMAQGGAYANLYAMQVRI